MDKFNEAKTNTRREINKIHAVDPQWALTARTMQIEAETFRDMVKDNGYVHTIPLDDLKFSWEE